MPFCLVLNAVVLVLPNLTLSSVVQLMSVIWLGRVMLLILCCIREFVFIIPMHMFKPCRTLIKWCVCVSPAPAQCYIKELLIYSYNRYMQWGPKTQLFGSNLEWKVLKTKYDVTLIVYMLSMKQRGWKERYIRIQMWILRFIYLLNFSSYWCIDNCFPHGIICKKW